MSRYDVLGLEHGVAAVGAADGQDLLSGNFDAIGGAGVLRLGWLELGVLYEGTLLDSRARSEVITPLAGFKIDLSDRVRLELLGELGGHRLTRIGSGNALVTQTETVWLPYVGVRPSLSLRLPLSQLRLVLSVTPFVRWDLVKKQVEVQTSSGGTASRTFYEAGGSTFGSSAASGFETPQLWRAGASAATRRLDARRRPRRRSRRPRARAAARRRPPRRGASGASPARARA